MGSLPSWRKTYGALKDSTTVSIAKINSDYKDLDVAIVKATNHVECPPKERHIRKILTAVSAISQRSDVVYCIQALARRLQRTHNWAVALKALLVIHRALREGDHVFRDELLHFSQRVQILQISNFKDDSSPLAWDCSAWVRTYGVFLEERLECFKTLKFDIEGELLAKSSQGSDKGPSKTRALGCEDLLMQLPALQQLLFRVLACKPEGAASCSYLVQFALVLVLKESFKIYCAINDGVINLVDLFFEMSRHNALNALDIYKKAVKHAEELSVFYEYCRGLELARNFQFPTLRQPPSTFLATMEEYIRDAPRVGSVTDKKLEYKQSDELISEPGSSKETPTVDSQFSAESEKQDSEITETEALKKATVDVVTQASPTTKDLLSMDDTYTAASIIEEGNALTFEIFQSGENPKSSVGESFDFGGSGWELALVTAPNGNSSHFPENQLAGGFDKLLLDSLYDNANSSNQPHFEGYSGGIVPNPFGVQDPFATSNTFAPPLDVQMATMAQQQLYVGTSQDLDISAIPFSYQPQFSQPPVGIGINNPFGDSLLGISQSIPPQGSTDLL